MTYACSKCGGDIRTPQFNRLMSDGWLRAALSLHEDHCAKQDPVDVVEGK